MLNLQTARKYVNPPKFQTLPLVEMARTSDIMKAVVDACNADKNQVTALAPHFRKATILETCRAVYDFLRNNVQYVPDDIRKMIIKTPERLLHDGFADCKGFSIFTKCVLDKLGIPCFFRFVGYNKDKEATHVYVVAIGENGNIPIDACIDKFNYELPYNHNTKKDMATSIVKMNGPQNQTGYTEYHSYVMCPCDCNKSKAGIGFGPDFGGFASGGNTNSGGGFNWQTVGGIVDVIRNGVGVVQEIKDIFSGSGNNPSAPVTPVFVPSTPANNVAETAPPQDNTVFYIGGAILAYVLLTQNRKGK